MKSLITTASIAVIGIALPALAQAQTAAPTGVYGTLGYAGTSNSGADVGAIQGRLGYRFNNYIGAEGELSGGVKQDRVGVAPGVDAKVKLNHQEAVYGVGFLPVTPKLDVLGRVGYGHSKYSVSVPGAKGSDASDSWNYGAGVQYHVDEKNGVRADYTREEFQRSAGGHADVWSVAYARHF
jgi:opacity protein-like surface antigen